MVSLTNYKKIVSQRCLALLFIKLYKNIIQVTAAENKLSEENMNIAIGLLDEGCQDEFTESRKFENTNFIIFCLMNLY